MNVRSWIGVVALLMALPWPAARAEPGITPTTIVIGQSVSLSGPTGTLGQEMEAGALAYFNHVNKRGGVNGRAIVLKTLDDAYEVDKTVANVKTLIEKENVFLLFGLRGTAHTNAAAKIFTPAQVPLFGTFSGAQSLREPFNRYIFHVRSSYGDETDAVFKQLAELKLNRIGVFYQNDGYGKEGKAAAEAAVKKYNLAISALGTVEPNSSDVTAAVAAIAKIQPQAIVMYASYKASAEFVRAMRKSELYAQYMNLSIVGTTALAKELGNDATDFGAEVIHRCNKLGIVVDVAHGPLTLVQRAARESSSPLILSHTSLNSAPRPRSRTISPEHARVIADTGGVIGVWPPTSIYPDLDAMAHGMRELARVVGAGHVGVGSDMLGLLVPSAFATYRHLPLLADALVRAGFTPDEASLVLGGNYARVYEQVLAAATV